MEFITNYRIEDYILGAKWEDFPQAVKDRAVVCAIDLSTALILGVKGRQHEVGVNIAKQIYQPGDLHVIGSAEKLSFMGMVMALGHASNSFDIDDGCNALRGHPGTSFVGGVMAAALERDITYREYLTALVVAYETTMRWGLAMQDFYKFMHSTGTYGAFGTAAGVGRIFGLSKETLNNALSIADFHAPLVPVMRAVEYPSMNKDGVPFGTMAGALAVVEAMNGYEGKTHLLEMPEYQYLLDTLGTEYKILDLYFKPYTCCRWAHQPISVSIRFMKENNFTWRDIKKVKVHTFKAAYLLSKIVPHTTDEAQYNIAYPVASALVNGDLGYMQVRVEALDNPDVLDVMSRLEFVIDPDLEAKFPAERLARVEFELTDGRRLHTETVAAPGEASDNVGLEWITEKFKRITGVLIDSDRQKKILDTLTGDQNIPIRKVWDTIGTF